MGAIDMNERHCVHCGRGRYVVQSINDATNQTLHCSVCNHFVSRYWGSEEFAKVTEVGLTNEK